MIGDGEILRRVFEQLGLHVSFRYEKYREEFAAEDVTIALDETPGRHLRRDRRERGRHSLHDARPRAERRTTSSSTPIVGSSSSIATSRGSTAPTWCSTKNDPGAGPDGRPRHSPSPTLIRSRQSCNPVGGEPIVRRILRGLHASGDPGSRAQSASPAAHHHAPGRRRQ